jgi:hypothetical protein
MLALLPQFLSVSFQLDVKRSEFTPRVRMSVFHAISDITLNLLVVGAHREKSMKFVVRLPVVNSVHDPKHPHIFERPQELVINHVLGHTFVINSKLLHANCNGGFTGPYNSKVRYLSVR